MINRRTAMVGSATLGAAACVSRPVMAATAKTEVVMLGTIHGAHRTSKRYSLNVLRRVITASRPAVVIAEIPPDRLAAARAGFASTGRVTEPRVSVFPEYVDVLFPLTRTLDFDIVAAAGWTQQLSDFREAALARIENDPARAAQWRTHQNAYATYERMVASRGDDPQFIHSDDYDALVKKAQTPYQRLFDKDLGAGAWTPINEAHYALIAGGLDAIRGQGKRVVITFGSWHKYWVLAGLRARSDVTLIDPRPLFRG